VWEHTDSSPKASVGNSPRTKYKRSKNAFSVTSIALSLGYLAARLLEFALHSLRKYLYLPSSGSFPSRNWKTRNSPPPHIYSRNWYAFSMLKLTKFPPQYGGGVHILLHKTFFEQVHSARLSCTADTRPMNEFEKGPNLAENRVEYVLLTTWYGNSIFFSANRARPGSQKLPLNGFTEWNSDNNKEKAYQNRE